MLVIIIIIIINQTQFSTWSSDYFVHLLVKLEPGRRLLQSDPGQLTPPVWFLTKKGK